MEQIILRGEATIHEVTNRVTICTRVLQEPYVKALVWASVQDDTLFVIHEILYIEGLMLVSVSSIIHVKMQLTARMLSLIICFRTIFIRRLVGSTDQAYSSDFYFRIAWKSMERPCLLQNHSLSLLQGLRSLKNWLLKKLSIKSLDQIF